MEFQKEERFAFRPRQVKKQKKTSECRLCLNAVQEGSFTNVSAMRQRRQFVECSEQVWNSKQTKWNVFKSQLCDT